MDSVSRNSLMTLAALLFLGGIALAQSHQHSEGSHSMHKQESATTGPCHMMTSQHKQMSEKMASMDGEVNQLVQEMELALGERKIKAMENLLTALVEQRTSMHTDMMAMMPMMMQHMSGHMGDKDHGCPMMEAMSASAQSSEDQDHSQHH